VRTTVDLPDAVFRELKARAAQEGTSIKELLSRAVRHELARAPTRARQNRVRFPILDSSEPGVVNLTNAEIDDLLA
jgi:metal-responsive CopG/Arc/MetJ family transcriptional regulator